MELFLSFHVNPKQLALVILVADLSSFGLYFLVTTHPPPHSLCVCLSEKTENFHAGCEQIEGCVQGRRQKLSLNRDYFETLVSKTLSLFLSLCLSPFHALPPPALLSAPGTCFGLINSPHFDLGGFPEKLSKLSILPSVLRQPPPPSPAGGRPRSANPVSSVLMASLTRLILALFIFAFLLATYVLYVNQSENQNASPYLYHLTLRNPTQATRR